MQKILRVGFDSPAILTTMATDTPTQPDSAASKQAADDTRTRQNLARWVAFGGMGAVSLLGIAAIFKGNSDPQAILTMLLPVIGTWVGTVLAFYFAKDNLLAATQSTKELLGLKERLEKIPVDDAMLKFGDAAILKKQLAANEDPQVLKLVALSKILREANRNRLPVLRNDGVAIFIIHLSTLTDFLAQKAMSGGAATVIAELTIADLKAGDVKLYESILKFAFVKRTATLADAKAACESKQGCADVFVTETGSEGEPVIGWITNVEIGRRSQV